MAWTRSRAFMPTIPCPVSAGSAASAVPDSAAADRALAPTPSTARRSSLSAGSSFIPLSAGLARRIDHFVDGVDRQLRLDLLDVVAGVGDHYIAAVGRQGGDGVV